MSKAPVDYFFILEDDGSGSLDYWNEAATQEQAEALCKLYKGPNTLRIVKQTRTEGEVATYTVEHGLNSNSFIQGFDND